MTLRCGRSGQEGGGGGARLPAPGLEFLREPHTGGGATSNPLSPKSFSPSL